MEKTIVLNLDLTCLKVSSQLEESLSVAASVAAQVKTAKASVLTIQCCITEDSLDYLIFKKFEGKFQRKFTTSPDVENIPNTCIAWKKDEFTGTSSDLSKISTMFPQTLCSSSTMVHLWAQNSTEASLSLVSWSGLTYRNTARDRLCVFETALRFFTAFRTLNNLKLRILIGGLFNIDIKIIQFWRYPDFLPVLYSNRPIPGERKELRSSFLFTKENIKITEFSAARIGERISDHWAVTAEVIPCQEKGEPSLYTPDQIGKVRALLSARGGEDVVESGHGEESRPQNGSRSGIRKPSKERNKEKERWQSKGKDGGGYIKEEDLFLALETESGDSNRSTALNLINNMEEDGARRRATQAYLCHVDRHSSKTGRDEVRSTEKSRSRSSDIRSKSRLPSDRGVLSYMPDETSREPIIELEPAPPVQVRTRRNKRSPMPRKKKSVPEPDPEKKYVPSAVERTGKPEISNSRVKPAGAGRRRKTKPKPTSQQNSERTDVNSEQSLECSSNHSDSFSVFLKEERDEPEYPEKTKPKPWTSTAKLFALKDDSFDNDKKVQSEQGEHEEQDLDEVEEEEDLAGQQTGEKEDEDEDEDEEKEKDTDKEPVENPDSE
ncbi:uncharacterized protein LOC111695055 isoform X4 [Eurytemora carolleeae]|uniref:uncharacterized protein LOC111695055 isoform X4 n=1 Tax=Eurytemora carolleeae TaxID=1294199 RepID=UPI000C76C03A|nr:uncharacterized protein LOC111695055 isoform X4 [Eurytemora carolleeae]|eukprot:XP_023319983.1 uncharacterized protein LOC111695055 isoform X4 [Eurytemora affinis]